MLKVDKKFVNEFLGEDNELTTDYVSPCKTWRMYSNNSRLIVVRTPLLHDFNFDEIIEVHKKFNLKVPTVEHHNRGKYLVSVFSCN